MMKSLRDTKNGYSSFSRCLCLFVCALLALSTTLKAQTEGSTFQGVWDFTTPYGENYVLILKRNGLASYFRSDNQDRTVYQGTWEKTEDVASVKWPDSSTYNISLQTSGYTIQSSGPNPSNNFSAIAARVPGEVLGQWTKAPQEEDALKSDRDEAKGYFGTWKIGEDAPYYVIVESDRSAASNWSGSKQGDRGLRGSWARQGSELHIIWDSGHYSILRGNDRGVTYKRIEPGAIIEEDTGESIATTRVKQDVIPSSWLNTYAVERENYTGGIVFSSRKAAREFYRGYWLIQRDENAYERFEIGRFGGLSTSRNPDLSGDWLMSGQDLFLRWDDGMRKILSPIGEGFVLFQFRPGRPLDGVPTQIFPSAPEDTAKLSEYINNRKDVARMLAESALDAGIDPKSGYGWGQSFMRWVSPFSSNDSGLQSDALIVDAYEAPNRNDPWWWPFWSEVSPKEEAPEAASAVNETETASAATNTEQSKPKAIAKETNWYWPF
jgi:hypothetical protein